MPLPLEIYPFATQDGKDIPLDIILPLAVVTIPVTAVSASLVLAAKFNLSAIFATSHCYMDLTGVGTTPVNGTTYDNWLFIPKETVVIAVLPAATIKVRALGDDGVLIVQGIQKWAALNLPRQFSGKASG